MAKERDEPLTPAGRLFLQPETTQIINCILGSKQPLNVDAIRSAVSSSTMINHPRFCSLLVIDRHGREYWRKTQVNIDDHIIVHNEPLSDDKSKDDDEVVNDYVADLTLSTPLSTDKPLWEIHLLMAHKCAVVRVHHALGDGISLMSLLLTFCRRADDPEKMPTINSVGTSSSASSRRSGRWGVGVLWKVMKLLWFTLVYVMEFGMRGLWMSDKKTAVSGGAGVELWPRKLATARFRLDDMKTVKKAVPDATINDVLFGVISAGLSKYLDMQKNPKDLREGLQITGLAMVNLRPQPGLQELSDLMAGKSGTRWGNKFGMLLLPVYYHKDGCEALHHLKTAKKMIDRKKLSLEAYFSYKIGYAVMYLLGAKFASWLNYRIICNTTFTISNVIGPREEITIAGNKVDYLRTTSTCLPHAITMHMMSYAGMADMQILVAKDIIPDPKVLAKCFEDALLEMKASAEYSKKL